MFRAAVPLLDVAARSARVARRRRRSTSAASPPSTPGIPRPNAGSVAAAERALALATESARRGGLLVLLSGGASAMLAAPVAGSTLDDKIETARLLMRAGAAIHELNCVRKHLSRIKGGRLAAAAGRPITLALSDVHGPVADDPSVIGSGPTVADRTTFADAAAIVENYRVELPAGRARSSGARPAGRGGRNRQGRAIARLESSTYTVIGNRQTAVAGARARRAAVGIRRRRQRRSDAGEASRCRRSISSSGGCATHRAGGDRSA